MKKILLLLVILAIAQISWENYRDSKRQLDPLEANHYIKIYSGCDCEDNWIPLKLNQYGIEFSFTNFRKNNNDYEEMKSRLQLAGYEDLSSVKLPVLDVNGYIMSNPDFNKVMEFYNKNLEQKVAYIEVDKKRRAAIKDLPPLYREPYIVVYGRDRCPITTNFRKYLDSGDIPFEYKSVDNGGVEKELHSRMAEGELYFGRYDLPVVDLNGVLYIRPPFRFITRKYMAYRN